MANMMRAKPLQLSGECCIHHQLTRTGDLVELMETWLAALASTFRSFGSEFAVLAFTFSTFLKRKASFAFALALPFALLIPAI